MPYEVELQAALEAAGQASRRILELYEPFVAIPDARADITTEADRDSQELILQALHARRPANVPSRQAVALQPARVEQTHSAGVKLARVARGEADIYVNHYPNFHDWDICAGHILVVEAGGRATGLKGQAIRYGLPGAPQ